MFSGIITATVAIGCVGLFVGLFLGIAAIIVINLTQKFTGVFVQVNWWTVGGSGIFGLPCVCGIVILQILI